MESKKFEDFEEEAKKYKKILLEYKNTKKQFVDPNFHPTLKIIEREVSISHSIDDWARVDDICNAPLFQKDIISSDFVRQGELGDCYFLSALSRIARQSYLIPPLFDRDTPNQVLGRVQDSINIKCGAVVIYFNCFGRKTPVLIDTYLPMKYGQFRFSSPSDNTKSPWFCLVEKAYAKLNGSYSDIVGGTLPRAIYSLYGYYPTNKDFEDLRKPEKMLKMSVFDRLMKYQKKGAVMGTAINMSKLKNGVTNEEIESKGLIEGHCYLLLKAREHDGKRFLCLRNPWGNHEWNGDWSDTSPKWTPELKEGLGWKPASDGTFWMIDKDYFRYFTTVEVSLPFLPEWYSRRFYVQITPGDHDGYNVESSKAKIAERPNFAFQVTQPIKKGEKCRFHILVEKRQKLYNEEGGFSWDPPQYCVLLAHANGKKLSPSIILDSDRFAMRSTMPLLAFSYEVKDNDDIVTIAIHRLQSCDLIEDCYVIVYCDHDFKLYDIDNPDQIIEDEDNGGVFFDNFSIRHPDIAKPIKKKIVKGKEVLDFGEISKTDFKSSRDERIAKDIEEINAKKDKGVVDPKKKSRVRKSSKDEDKDDEDKATKEKESQLKTKKKERVKFKILVHDDEDDDDEDDESKEKDKNSKKEKNKENLKKKEKIKLKEKKKNDEDGDEDDDTKKKEKNKRKETKKDDEDDDEEDDTKKKEKIKLKEKKKNEDDDDTDEDYSKLKEKMKTKPKEKLEKNKEKEKDEALKAKEKEKNDAIKAIQKEKEEALNEKNQELEKANKKIEKLKALQKTTVKQKKENDALIKQMKLKIKSQDELDELKSKLEKERKEIELEKKKIISEKKKNKQLIDEEVKRRIKKYEEKMKKEMEKKKKVEKSDSSDNSDSETPKSPTKTTDKKTTKSESSDEDSEPTKKETKKIVKPESSDEDSEPHKKEPTKKETKKIVKPESSDEDSEPTKKETKKIVISESSDEDSEPPKKELKRRPSLSKFRPRYNFV